MVVEFIDSQKGRFGVVPICRVLSGHGVGIAPSSYYAYKSRPASERSRRDVELLAEIERVYFGPGRGKYGVRKVWRQLKAEGHEIARCTVERLMRQAGLVGVIRGVKRRTTISDPSAVRPPDLVNREFKATRPNELWVVDFTYVSTWQQTAYTAFVTDVYSRRIVGWRCATSMPTELPLDALEMALDLRARRDQDVTGLVHHSDAGSPNISRFATPRNSFRPARWPRSAASATATTTPSPRASSASTKQSASTTKDPGTPSKHSSSRPSSGSIGTTRSGSTRASTTTPL